MDGFSAQSDGELSVQSVSHGRFRRPAKLTARLALTSDDLVKAYQLRHSSYLSYGFIKPQPEGLFSDPFDNETTSRTILIFKDGRAAGTVRVSLFDPRSSSGPGSVIPSTGIFGAEIESLIAGMGSDAGPGRAVEINRLARGPDFADDNDLIFALYRMACYMTYHMNGDVAVISVRRHHMPLYRRLGFKKVADAKPYPGIMFETGLMAMFSQDFEHYQSMVPAVRSVSRQDAIYAGLIAGEMVPVYADSAVADPRQLPVPMPVSAERRLSSRDERKALLADL